MIGFNQFVEYTQLILKIQGPSMKLSQRNAFFYLVLVHPVGALEFLVYSWFVSQTSSQLKAIFPREKIEMKFLIFLRDPSKIFLLQICNQCLESACPRPISRIQIFRWVILPFVEASAFSFLECGSKMLDISGIQANTK